MVQSLLQDPLQKGLTGVAFAVKRATEAASEDQVVPRLLGEEH